jgi:hypothetical protein
MESDSYVQGFPSDLAMSCDRCGASAADVPVVMSMNSLAAVCYPCLTEDERARLQRPGEDPFSQDDG